MQNDRILLKNDELAANEIWGRALHDPIIHRYLVLFQQNELTYKQALQGMVIHLNNEKNRLANELTSEINNRKG